MEQQSFITKIKHLSAVILLIASVSCSKKIAPEAPEEAYDVAALDALTSEISYITVPFEISIKELEKQINAEFSGLIYNDDSFDSDELKVKIWKQKDLIFEARPNGFYSFKVPLKIWVEKQISVLGMKQSPSTEFEIVANFSSKPFISANWELNTLTNAEGFTWITQPKLSLGGVSIPITTVVEAIIRNNQGSIARMIDQQVKNEINIAKPILTTWNTIKEPFLVSKDYNIWVRIVPQDILMTELKSDKGKISTAVAVKAQIHSSVGKTEAKITKSTELPPIKFVNTLPDECSVFLYNLVTFSEAERIASDLYRGEKFDLGSGRTMEILGIRIFGGKNNKLNIEIKSAGDINGTIFLNGDPVYDEKRRELILKNTQFDLKTRNVLKKAASWVLESRIEKTIEKEFGIPVDPIFESAKAATDQINNTPIWRGAYLQGKIATIKPGKVYLEPRGLMTTLEVKGKFGVKL
jgi:hypothetical protein